MTDQKSKINTSSQKQVFEKRIKDYVLNLIQFLQNLPADRIIGVISNQLMRSGSSVGANYFEAKAASSKNDFINFYTHALKSANESKFWFEMLIESGLCEKEICNGLLQETQELSRILAASILTLKNKRIKF